jgi:molybdate transport system permease protein
LVSSARPIRYARLVLGRVGVAVAVTGLGGLLGLPLVSLFTRVPLARLIEHLGQPVVVESLVLSLWTTLCATAVVVMLGLPVAYLLATRSFVGKRALEVLVEVPIVLPPTVAGLALLLAFGRMGLAGGALSALGITLPFTALAVIVAQVFVGTPFFVSTAVAGFRAVEPRFLDAAATLGAHPGYVFRRVALPLALPSLMSGTALAWARALGEFGATIMFAGNFPGRTQTMPLAVYSALETDLTAAITLSVLLLLLSAGILLAVRAAPWRVGRDAPRDAR